MYEHTATLSGIHDQTFVTGRTYAISYTNDRGTTTSRTIRPLRIFHGNNGHGYLRAYCSLRGQERTFRLDRANWCRLSGNEGPSAGAGCSGFHAASHPTEAAPAGTRHRSPTVTTTAASPSVSPSAFVSTVPVDSTPSRLFGRVKVALVIGAILAIVYLADPDLFNRFWGIEDVYEIPKRIPLPDFVDRGRAQREELQPKEVKPVEISYLGTRITVERGNQGMVYQSAVYGVSARTAREIHLKINSIRFQKATGINNGALERMYASADTDGDGYVTWKEIQAFQTQLGKWFRYKRNGRALKPDQFLDQGGGDCEDWALMTAAFLRYWGWKPYVGVFDPPDQSTAHAVCMVWWGDKPPGFDSHYVSSGRTVTGGTLKAGYYVPIDYEVVGGRSSAMDGTWRLARMYDPEMIYGRAM